MIKAVFERRSHHRARLACLVVAGSSLTLAGCGGAGQTAPAPIAAPTPAPSPAPSPSPPPAPPISNFNTAEYQRSDGANYHNASTPWALSATGSGVTVAVIDSGVDADSPEFIGRIHPMSADVAGGGRGYDEAGSDGHGTNVSQLLLGARNDRGTVGIAWNATLLALRADRPGSCNDATVTDPAERGCRFSDVAIAAGVDRAVTAGAKIINISLGGSTPTQILLDAVNRAASAGTVIIVSAGNNGDSTDPADDPSNPDPFARGLLAAGNGLVIIAGSNNETGQISAFSNRAGAGASNYLLALGERVCCDYENGDLRREVTADGSYVFVISGTSFAAPQIAGAAALLAQAFPNLTGRQIVDLLLTTATDVGVAGIDPINGRGILNIPRAFAPQGTTTLAHTGVALPLDRMAGHYSAVMGDAGLRVSSPAVVLDHYARAYSVSLSQLMMAPVGRTTLLAPLVGGIQTVAGDRGNVSMSLAMRPGRDGTTLMPSRFSGDDMQRARLLAGTMVARLSARASLGVAVGQGATGMANLLAGRQGEAFLAADAVTASPLSDGRGNFGSAIRLGFGRGLTVAATGETGEVGVGLADGRLWDITGLSRASHYSRWAFELEQKGRIRSMHWQGSVGVSMLNEANSLLGARLSETLGRSSGHSLFVDGAASAEWRERWRLAARWREGWTDAGGAGLVAGATALRTRGWAVDLSRQGLFADNDRMAFRVSQPLRVEAGALLLNLPIGYDYATRIATQGQVRLPLAPLGREHALEAVWSGPALGGWLTLNAFWRDQPGHVAAAADDVGGAVRFALGF